ncbi:MAG: APC family permease [Verrucomicrobiaceae bacterium]|nr:APC family permease [Verrucomicrobiaceae bacterium]
MLERRFNTLQATALNMTNMLGAGPFITIPLLIAAMGGPQSMLGWAVALLITLADGLVWSELGAAMPHSGGTYGYLRRAFSPLVSRLMAFLFIWQLIISGPMEIASALVGIRPYLAYVWPQLTELHTQLVSVGMALVIIWLLYRRIDSIAKLTVALWVGVLITVAVVIAVGAMHFDPKLAFDFPKGWWQPDGNLKYWMGFMMGLASASSIGIYDYLGYYDICYIGDEVKNPGRTIPRAVLFSLVGVALIYLCIHLSFLGSLPWREVSGKDGFPIAAVFMEKWYGRSSAILLTLLIIWTTYAGVFALTLGYSRIPYAAARDGGFFKVFGKLHPTGAFPHLSLVVIGLLSIAFAFMSLSTIIGALLITRFAVQFIGQIAALIWLRQHQPQMARPFKMWLYPLPCMIALAGWLFLIASFDLQIKIYGLGAVVLGTLAFFIWETYKSPPKDELSQDPQQT